MRLKFNLISAAFPFLQHSHVLRMNWYHDKLRDYPVQSNILKIILDPLNRKLFPSVEIFSRTIVLKESNLREKNTRENSGGPVHCQSTLPFILGFRVSPWRHGFSFDVTRTFTSGSFPCEKASGNDSIAKSNRFEAFANTPMYLHRKAKTVSGFVVEKKSVQTIPEIYKLGLLGWGWQLKFPINPVCTTFLRSCTSTSLVLFTFDNNNRL